MILLYNCDSDPLKMVVLDVPNSQRSTGSQIIIDFPLKVNDTLVNGPAITYRKGLKSFFYF